MCLKQCVANSVDPDQMLHSATSDLGRHCLHRSICPNAKSYCGNVPVVTNIVLNKKLFVNKNYCMLKYAYVVL